MAEVEITYTNWRGETGRRRIVPTNIWHGATEYHAEPQWLLHAFDVDKQAYRDFALKDIGERQADIEVESLRQVGAGLLAQNSELLDALSGLWSYATTGASVTDVYVSDQPQFIKAKALLVASGRMKG